jgi:hypothetical protein
MSITNNPHRATVPASTLLSAPVCLTAVASTTLLAFKAAGSQSNGRCIYRALAMEYKVGEIGRALPEIAPFRRDRALIQINTARPGRGLPAVEIAMRRQRAGAHQQ